MSSHRFAIWVYLAACFALAEPACAQDGLEQLKNSLVRMEVRKGPGRAANIGTGFVVSADSQWIRIVTANHLLVANANEGESLFVPDPWVTFYTDKLNSHPASFVKDAPNLDLAVVQVKTSEMPGTAFARWTERPESVPLADADATYTLASDTDLWPVVPGKISALNVKDRADLLAYSAASIRKGMSGAPMVDSDARWIGVHLGALEEDNKFGRAVKATNAITALDLLGVPLSNVNYTKRVKAYGPDAGTVSFLGCPDGASAIVNGVPTVKAPGVELLSLCQLSPGTHAVRLVRKNWSPRDVVVTVDPTRHVQEPCRMEPDLEAKWNFPVAALTAGFKDACKTRLATDPASAVFHGERLDPELTLYGELQTEQDKFQTCDFATSVSVDPQGKVRLTFIYADDYGKKKIATANLSANAEVTELTGAVTDLSSGSTGKLVLLRDYVLPMYSHCKVEPKQRGSSDGLATIRVTALDQTGGSITGAAVFIEKTGATAQNFDFRKDTDIDGIRQVTATPGKYHLSVYQPGYGSEILDDVPVGANQVVDVRCRLFRLQ